MEPPFWDTGIPFNWRILGIFLSYIVLAGWIKYVVGPRSLGSTRVIAALPIFISNTICPWIFNWNEELMARLSTVFIFSWLCNFKVLAFCWGRAPLWASMTLSQLAAAILLPVFPKQPESSMSGPKGRLHDTAGCATSLATRWIAKIALLGFVVFLIIQFGDSMQAPLRHYTYAFGLYAFVGFLMDGPGALAMEALGLQLIPTFDLPWLSSSLADFWGRRWNIPTASVLRTIAYDTIIDGSLIKPTRHLGRYNDGGHHQHHNQQQQHHHESPSKPQGPSLLRRQLALNCTFFVSGIVHEYIAWVIVGDGKWGWKWTLFFWIQAPMMTLEAICGHLLRRWRVQIPRPLVIILTLTVLELLAYDLFFGFVDKDTDIAARTVAAVSSSYHSLLAPLQPQITRLATRLRLELGL